MVPLNKCFGVEGLLRVCEYRRVWAALDDHLKGCVVYFDNHEEERLKGLKRKFYRYYLGSCSSTTVFDMDWRDYFLSGGFVGARRLPLMEMKGGVMFNFDGNVEANLWWDSVEDVVNEDNFEQNPEVDGVEVQEPEREQRDAEQVYEDVEDLDLESLLSDLSDDGEEEKENVGVEGG